MKNKKRAVSLIVLVITIIIMIILSSAVIMSLTGNNGIISNARKAAFYTEMDQLEERKETTKIMSFMSAIRRQVESEEAFLSSNMTEAEITDLPNTLKAEIIYTRHEYGDYMQMTTNHVWKNNMFECKDIYEDEDLLEGLTRDLMYVNEKITGKAKGYIYDSVTDTIYKVSKTNIANKTVHSLNYAKFIIDGQKVKGKIIEEETKVETATDGTKYYEPDLNNFTYKTEIVYYSSNLNTEKTITVDEYIKQGKPKTITVGSSTYTFANYTATGTKVWANIKTVANGIEAYWVWIPRYAYKLNQDTQKADVIYVDINDKPLDTEKYGAELPEGYTVHEGFHQKDNLKGIWFSKYNPSIYETIPVDNSEGNKPDLSNFNQEKTKLIYYTANLAKTKEVDYTANPDRVITEGTDTYYFYDYSKKIWPNIKTEANEIIAYWVWIPRFAYKLEVGNAKVILIDENDKPLDTAKYGNKLPSAYTVHEAFRQGDGLKGLWFSKYQPSKIEVEE